MFILVVGLRLLYAALGMQVRAISDMLLQGVKAESEMLLQLQKSVSEMVLQTLKVPLSSANEVATPQGTNDVADRGVASNLGGDAPT